MFEKEVSRNKVLMDTIADLKTKVLFIPTLEEEKSRLEQQIKKMEEGDADKGKEVDRLKA